MVTPIVQEPEVVEAEAEEAVGEGWKAGEEGVMGAVMR